MRSYVLVCLLLFAAVGFSDDRLPVAPENATVVQKTAQAKPGTHLEVFVGVEGETTYQVPNGFHLQGYSLEPIPDGYARSCAGGICRLIPSQSSEMKSWTMGPEIEQKKALAFSPSDLLNDLDKPVFANSFAKSNGVSPIDLLADLNMPIAFTDGPQVCADGKCGIGTGCSLAGCEFAKPYSASHNSSLGLPPGCNTFTCGGKTVGIGFISGDPSQTKTWNHKAKAYLTMAEDKAFMASLGK